MTSPVHERCVVTNTTPLIALGLLGRCELLRQLYGEIVIPPAVHAEIAAEGPAPSAPSS